MAPSSSEEQFQSQLGAYGPDTAIDLVPNLRLLGSNRLDLKGPAYTVDGACASSLIAVDPQFKPIWPMRPRLSRRGSSKHDVAFWSVFCQSAP